MPEPYIQHFEDSDVSQKSAQKTKLRFVKCYIYSVLLCEIQTWTVSKKMERKINCYSTEN